MSAMDQFKSCPCTDGLHCHVGVMKNPAGLLPLTLQMLTVVLGLALSQDLKKKKKNIMFGPHNDRGKEYVQGVQIYSGSL